MQCKVPMYEKGAIQNDFSGSSESQDLKSLQIAFQKISNAIHRGLMRTFSCKLHNWLAHLLELISLESLFPSLLQRALSSFKYSTKLPTQKFL